MQKVAYSLTVVSVIGTMIVAPLTRAGDSRGADAPNWKYFYEVKRDAVKGHPVSVRNSPHPTLSMSASTQSTPSTLNPAMGAQVKQRRKSSVSGPSRGRTTLDPMIERPRSAADIGGLLVAAFALLLAVGVAVIRWKDLFRSDLRKRQLEELATVRRQLHDIWVEFYYLTSTRDMMDISRWNLDDLRNDAPGQWKGYMRYSACSRSLFYKLQSPNYFLFPRWLDTKQVAALKSAMSPFAPFTLISSTTQEEAVRRQYMDAILAFIDYLDQQLQKRY